MRNTESSNRNKTGKTIRKVKRSNIKSSVMILLVVTVFCMFSIVLVYQRNVINDLDTQIATLESSYKKASMINDDLSGQLIRSKNLNEVENYAVNTLGMIKPQNNDVTYVAYSNDGTNANANSNAEIKGEGSFLSWVSALFN